MFATCVTISYKRARHVFQRFLSVSPAFRSPTSEEYKTQVCMGVRGKSILTVTGDAYSCMNTERASADFVLHRDVWRMFKYERDLGGRIVP